MAFGVKPCQGVAGFNRSGKRSPANCRHRSLPSRLQGCAPPPSDLPAVLHRVM